MILNSAFQLFPSYFPSLQVTHLSHTLTYLVQTKDKSSLTLIAKSSSRLHLEMTLSNYQAVIWPASCSFIFPNIFMIVVPLTKGASQPVITGLIVPC